MAEKLFAEKYIRVQLYICIHILYIEYIARCERRREGEKNNVYQQTHFERMAICVHSDMTVRSPLYMPGLPANLFQLCSETDFRSEPYLSLLTYIYMYNKKYKCMYGREIILIVWQRQRPALHWSSSVHIGVWRTDDRALSYPIQRHRYRPLRDQSYSRWSNRERWQNGDIVLYWMLNDVWLGAGFDSIFGTECDQWLSVIYWNGNISMVRFVARSVAQLDYHSHRTVKWCGAWWTDETIATA